MGTPVLSISLGETTDGQLWGAGLAPGRIVIYNFFYFQC